MMIFYIGLMQQKKNWEGGETSEAYNSNLYFRK